MTFSSADVVSNAVWDGKKGTDTLILTDIALSEAVAAGVDVRNFESFRTDYASAVSSDELLLGASSFKYSWEADGANGDYALHVQVIDPAGSTVATLEFSASDVGGSTESSTVKITRGSRSGAPSGEQRAVRSPEGWSPSGPRFMTLE